MTVVPIDTPLMRWRLLQAAVERAREERSPEAIAAVDEACRAYAAAHARKAG